MSKAERLSLKIEETKKLVCARAAGRCQAILDDGTVCGKPGTQAGHVLPKDVLHLARYGDEIVNHPDNMRWVCDLECNRKVQINYRGHPVAADAHANTIRETLANEWLEKGGADG